MRGIETRQIKAEDLPQIIVIQQAITKRKASRRWVQMVENQLRKPDAVGFVATHDGKVNGFVIGEVKGEGFGLEQSGWIEVVGVHPSQMGVGIGHALTHRLFQYFKKRGIHDVYTAVRWDAVDMLSFFKSIGFDRSPFINLIRRLD